MTVSGSDANTYPPMSTQLESLGIELTEGYQAENIPENTDIIIVGNTISRGNPELEHVLDMGLPYTSGAQWLGEHVLRGRWVIGVAGTHGKTTTSSMLAWILQANDLSPGYLIGGVPENFGTTARIGDTPFFVIEADEYDTAFSDKRSKFVHYRPRTLILNNLEFDHADIFNDLQAIQTQFHHLIKTVPQNGQIIVNQESPAISELLAWGIWSDTRSFNGKQSDWQATKHQEDASEFDILYQDTAYRVKWNLIGDHNMCNAVAAVAAAYHVGIPIANSTESLAEFKSVKRRMEMIFDDGRVRAFDDFAHHPTAIKETLNGLRRSVKDQRIIAVLEPRSNTMKRGVHKHLLEDALSNADEVLIFADDSVQWQITELANDKISAFKETGELLDNLLQKLRIEDQPCNVLIMSNGGFENLYKRLIDKLS